MTQVGGSISRARAKISNVVGSHGDGLERCVGLNERPEVDIN